MVEYDAIVNHVTMWNVAVERQIRVKGPDAEKFVDYVITRDATKISPMRARYVILCNAYGGVLNDPILLRISKDEFWFSLSDSDIGLYLQGVNADERFNVNIDEIDVSPVQIQGPKSKALMKDLCGDHVDFDNMPFYGLAEAKVGGRSVVDQQLRCTPRDAPSLACLHSDCICRNEILQKGPSLLCLKSDRKTSRCP